MFDKNGNEFQFHSVVKSKYGPGLIQGRSFEKIGGVAVERLIVSYNPRDPNVSDEVRKLAAHPNSVWVLVHHLSSELEVITPVPFAKRERHARTLA